MRYILKTTKGDYALNFGNYFLQKLAKNKGVDYTKAASGLFTEFSKLFKDSDGKSEFDPEAKLTPFLDELVYVIQAAHQAANAERGIFEKVSLEELEYLALGCLGGISEMFTKYGEIVNMVGQSISPDGLGSDEPKQKKSQANKRK